MSGSRITPPPLVKDQKRPLNIDSGTSLSGINFDKLKEFRAITSRLDLEIESMGKGLKLRRNILRSVNNEDYFHIVWREINKLRRKYLELIAHRNHVAQALLKEI